MQTKCTVTNRSAGSVVYQLPDRHIVRTYAPGETRKNVSVDELEALAQTRGGRNLIFDRLYIHEQEVAAYVLNGDPAPEYWLTEEKIPSWLQTCSLDEFKDALDFAPDGIIDLIKKFAVELPLNDYAKRQAMLDQLGYNVTKIVDELMVEDKDTVVQPVKVAGRRAAASSIEVPAEPIVVSK